jgi:hypothetical protein
MIVMYTHNSGREGGGGRGNGSRIFAVSEREGGVLMFNPNLPGGGRDIGGTYPGQFFVSHHRGTD